MRLIIGRVWWIIIATINLSSVLSDYTVLRIPLTYHIDNAEATSFSTILLHYSSLLRGSWQFDVSVTLTRILLDGKDHYIVLNRIRDGLQRLGFKPSTIAGEALRSDDEINGLVGIQSHTVVGKLLDDAAELNGRKRIKQVAVASHSSEVAKGESLWRISRSQNWGLGEKGENMQLFTTHRYALDDSTPQDDAHYLMREIDGDTYQKSSSLGNSTETEESSYHIADDAEACGSESDCTDDNDSNRTRAPWLQKSIVPEFIRKRGSHHIISPRTSNDLSDSVDDATDSKGASYVLVSMGSDSLFCQNENLS